MNTKDLHVKILVVFFFQAEDGTRDGHVTVVQTCALPIFGKDTHQLPEPFVVLATENPIETDGTYPLPEAQLDRFMLKVLVDYPSFQDEVVVVERITGPEIKLRQVVTLDQLREMQKSVAEVSVDPA